MHEVFLQFKSIVSDVCVAILILDRFETCAIPVTGTVVPALVTLITKVINQHCIVCSIFRIWFRKRFNFADLDRESASVQRIIHFRIDRKDDDISCFDFKDLIKVRSLVLGEVALGPHPFHFLSIDEDSDSCAIGFRITIVRELGVVAFDIDCTVFCDNPLVSCILAVARCNIVFLQFNLRAVVVSVICLVIGNH